MSKVIVTRGSQITLTQNIRNKLGIREGDVIIMNVIGDNIIASKKDPGVFRSSKDFLPENFEKTLSKIRENPLERLKKLRIT